MLHALFALLECTLVAAFTIIYIHFRCAQRRWERLKVPTLPPTAKYGNFGTTPFYKLDVSYLYNAFKGQSVGGLYKISGPAVLARDVTVIHRVLKFQTRIPVHGIHLSHKVNLCTRGLHAVLPTLLTCAQQLEKEISRGFRSGCLADLINRYISDVTSACVFGVPASSLQHPHVEFGVLQYVKSSVKRVLNQEVRNHCLLQQFIGLDEVIVTDMAKVFVAASQFVTATMIQCLHELDLNQDILNKVRAEVKQYKKSIVPMNESLQKMKFLEKVLLETLRKHPPVSLITKECNEQTTFAATDTILEPGIDVHIPVSCLLQDPEHFHNPGSFKPDRFNYKQAGFLAFGAGDSCCAGAEFALIQMKVGLTAILHFTKTETSQ